MRNNLHFAVISSRFWRKTKICVLQSLCVFFLKQSSCFQSHLKSDEERKLAPRSRWHCTTFDYRLVKIRIKTWSLISPCWSGESSITSYLGINKWIGSMTQQESDNLITTAGTSCNSRGMAVPSCSALKSTPVSTKNAIKSSFASQQAAINGFLPKVGYSRSKTSMKSL